MCFKIRLFSVFAQYSFSFQNRSILDTDFELELILRLYILLGSVKRCDWFDTLDTEKKNSQTNQIQRSTEQGCQHPKNI